MVWQRFWGLQASAVVALLVSANVGWGQTWTFQQPDTGAVFKRNLGETSVTVTLQGSRETWDADGVEVRLVEEVRADTITWLYGLNPWDPSFAFDWEASPLTSWQGLSFDNGNFSAQYDVQEGGWYRFQLRSLTGGNTPVDTVFSGWFRVRTFFDDYQIIQRDIGGTSRSVTIEGTCSQGSAAQVQARVVNHGTSTPVVDWTTIDNSLSGGAFSGGIVVPQGGWYNAQIRALDGGGGAVASENCTQRIGVGVNVLVIGQSNICGAALDSTAPQVVANDLAACFSNTDEWEHLEDPYEHSGRDGDIDKQWWGDLGGTHSLIPPLANALIERYQIPFGFIPCARGGTALLGTDGTSWGYRNSSRHNDSTTLYGNSILNAQRVGGVEMMIFWQGESDAEANFSGANYQPALQQLVAKYREDLTPNIPLFMVQVGRSAYSGKIDESLTGIRAAHANVDNGTDVFLAAVSVDRPLAPNDPWHLRPAQHNIISTRLANTIAHYYGDVSIYRGPTVSSAEFAPGTRSEILVRIAHRGGTDITPQDNIAGFTVLNSGQLWPVQSTRRESANTVRVVLFEPAKGNVEVRYMYGRVGNDATTEAVRDNSSLQLPLEPTVSPVTVTQPPAITLLSPNGGQTWRAGSVHGILWESKGAVPGVKIEVSTDNGGNWTQIVASAPNTGSSDWTVPGTALSTCKIRVSKAGDPSVSSMSANTFTIVQTASSASQIQLSSSSVAENQPAGTTVGTFSPSATYTLVAGTGSEGNAQFTIDGVTLKTAAVLDFETSDYRSIRVNSSQGPQETFVIQVTNVNDPPTIVSSTPSQSTVACKLDTVIDFDVQVSDQDNSPHQLTTGWTLDGSPVGVPLHVTEPGQHTVVYSVTDNQSTPVTVQWSLTVNARVLTTGQSVTATVPTNGLLRFEDESGNEVRLNFYGGDFAHESVTFRFVPLSDIPSNTEWPNQEGTVIDSTGLFRFSVLPLTENFYNLDLSVTDPRLGLNHFFVYLDTISWDSLDPQYYWGNYLQASYLDTAENTLMTTVQTSYHSWKRYNIWNIVQKVASDTVALSAKPVGRSPRRELLPTELGLMVASNPMSGLASIKCLVPERFAGKTLTMRLLNLKGQTVATLFRRRVEPGVLTLLWNPSTVPIGAGTYLCRLDVRGQVRLVKFALGL